MDSLNSFMDEMLRDDLDMKKDQLLATLLDDLETQPIPTLEQAKTGFTITSSLHGIYMDYECHEVKITYKVVDNLYEPHVMNFAHFAVIVEGLIACRRKHRWQVEGLNT